MSRAWSAPVIGLTLGSLAAAFSPRDVAAQKAPPRVVSRDTVTLAAGSHYDAGAFKRFFLGDTYRDYWEQPVRVPELNLRTYAGGLKPLKEGGGMQTKNLRLGAVDGSEYVFRPVNKVGISTPGRFKGSFLDAVFRDQISALFPAAGVVAAPIVAAAGVLHATPQFTATPNDTLLGKYREDFVGKLATIEQYPTKPEDAPGFAGAVDVIGSNVLLPILDSIPARLVDDRSFLAARLTDMLIADNDRHPGNWKWARFGPSETALYVAVPRDRDHAFHNYDGLLARLASHFENSLTTFEGKYPSIASLSGNSREMDRRLLAGVEKPVYDSIAAALEARITDAVIDSAVLRMPAEYRSAAPAFAAKIKQRRDALPFIANEFYALLSKVVDVHATDAADRATITYLDGGLVDVHLRSGNNAPYYTRRFDARETKEVRVYLHDGDDAALVRGVAPSGITVRVIGGNGTNELVDSSHVGGRGGARLYDVGRVAGFVYGPDSLRDTLFNRRPWVKDTGSYEPAPPDVGQSFTPVGELGGGSGLGFAPMIGVTWVRYGFRNDPYHSMLGLQAEYSTGIGGYRLTLLGDRRVESSRMHYMATARMSDFEVISFHGYGNDTDGEPEDFYDVRQRQWLFQPAFAVALGRRESDLTIGPVIQFSTTDSTAERFIADQHPYGFGNFGQAGVRLGVRYDTRDNKSYARRGFLVDVNGSAFPAMWDVESAFSQVSGSATTFFELPLPKHPILAFRGGGRKVWGDAPFHEAAFIGGRGTVRGMDAQRYAGDASLYGTSELRVPMAHVKFPLPIDIGLLGFVDAGRVYVDGESPGGWHTVAGGGLWLGIIDEARGFSVTFTNSTEKRVLIGSGLKF